MYVRILNAAGGTLVHRNIRTDQTRFLALIAPYRDDLVVCVECIFTWYWIADVCAREHIAFVLDHALYMKAIHGDKAKNDKLDSPQDRPAAQGGYAAPGLRLPERNARHPRPAAPAPAPGQAARPSARPHPEHRAPVQPAGPGGAAGLARISHRQYRKRLFSMA